VFGVIFASSVVYDKQDKDTKSGLGMVFSDQGFLRLSDFQSVAQEEEKLIAAMALGWKTLEE
jgi:hypothetical protein